ncbi:MAG: outer membrane beta-barrel protein [Bacteroidetes bacterium]|nr:outer membrane beta-barrel protein [Bacteroidota bacterium]
MKSNKTVLTILLLTILSINSYAQDRKVSFSAGVNLPVGGFSDIYKAGPSAQIGFVFLSLPLIPLDLSVNAEYNSFGYKNSYFTDQFKTNLGATASGFTPDWMASDFSIMFGGRLKLPGLIVNPYGEAQVGVHFMNFNQRLTGQINASSSDPSNISLAGATESVSETGVGTSFGVGTEISIIPKLTIDIGVKYNYAGITYSKGYTVFRNNNSQYTSPEMKNASFITTRAGIMISF